MKIGVTRSAHNINKPRAEVIGCLFKKPNILIYLKLQSTMDNMSFDAKLIDFEEIDFYSDADEELINIEETDLGLSDVSDKKTLMD